MNSDILQMILAVLNNQESAIRINQFADSAAAAVIRGDWRSAIASAIVAFPFAINLAKDIADQNRKPTLAEVLRELKTSSC